MNSRLAGNRLVAVLLLAVLTAICFLPALNNGFVLLDDHLYLTKNPHVQRGLSLEGIRWAFTTGTATNWHPLTWLSHQLDWTLFGDNARGHHAVSVAMHAVSAVLALVLLLRLVQPAPVNEAAKQNRRASHDVAVSAYSLRSLLECDGVTFVACWLAAALWAVHPLRVESVVWVSERKDVLATLLGLAALLAYCRYVDRGRGFSDLLLTACLLALGLLAKPTLVTLPLVMLLLDYWPLGRVSVAGESRRSVFESILALVVEKWPLLALCAVSSVVTFLVQQSGGAVAESLPLATRFSISLHAYGMYLATTVWPAELACFYPLPAELLSEGLSYRPTLLALFTLVFISAIAIWQYRRRPYLIVGWLWFVGMLVPVIGIVKVGDQAWADRYTYLPQLGLLVMLLPQIIELLRSQPQWSKMFVVAAAVLLVVLGVLTWQQSGTWHDTGTLANQALAVTENNFVAHYLQGLAALDRDDTPAAMEAFEQSLAFSPDNYFALNDLGRLRMQSGQIDQAELRFKHLIEVQPQLSLGYAGLAAVVAKRGDLTEAKRLLLHAAELAPDDPLICDNLAAICQARGENDEAARWERTAAQLQRDGAGT